MPKNLEALITLNHFFKFGPQSIKKLKKYFGDLDLAQKASQNDLIKAGIKKDVAQEFLDFKKDFDLAKILAEIEKEKIKIITEEDENYPKLLAEIPTAPPLLYYKGDFNLASKNCISIIGSRKNSRYGEQAAHEIVAELARENLVIVSGLALGMDGLAHQACLEAGGETIAVLGSGLSHKNIYPTIHQKLAQKILANNGLLISEFPPGAKAMLHYFPQRNRIIAGLSRGTLVIEAGLKSGSLITAYLALDFNREVMAVPGSIYSPVSEGANSLIQKGAHLITKADDILAILGVNKKEDLKNKETPLDNKEEAKIFQSLSKLPIHINEIIKITQLDTQVANATLTIMEIKGLIKNLGNNNYIKQ